MSILSLGFVTLLFVILKTQIVPDAKLRHKIEEGKKQLQVLFDNENADPLCWKENILVLINEKCDMLTYEIRTDIAVKLTLCHLQQSGIINDVKCGSSNKECIQKIASNDVSFSTYNHFFTHIENICIYVTMSENDKNMKKSVYDLYTATIDNADYLMDINKNQKEFQNEIKKVNEELIEINQEHKLNLINLQSTSSNIQIQQNNIFNKQKEFENNQNDILDTVSNINNKQENVLKNQDKIDENIQNLNAKHSEMNDNIYSSISLQKESLKKQHEIRKQQDSFHDKLNENNEKVNNLFEESSKKQNMILSKQDDAFDSITNIHLKTKELKKETNDIQNGLNNAKKDIQELTQQSHDSYKQIMEMVDQILFVVQAIYRMDVSILKQFISVQSFTFYLFWCVVSYFGTMPQRVYNSRVFLFLIIIICVVLEKCLLSPMYGIYDVSEIAEYTILLRKFMFTLSVAIYIWFFITYRDSDKQQLKLLHKINTNLSHSFNHRIKRINFRSALKSITPTNIRGFWFKKF